MKKALLNLTRCRAVKALLFILTCLGPSNRNSLFIKAISCTGGNILYVAGYLLFGCIWFNLLLNNSEAESVACVYHSVSAERKGILL